jgi:uncharacterized membrane protein YdbT with pleckstrin-like domain
MRVLAVSHATPKNPSSVLWKGKPWVTPAAVSRTVLVIIVAGVVVWLEFFFKVQQYSFFSLPLALWTGFLFVLIWAFSLVHLLLLRASNTYVLRNDSLEIRTGILTSRSFIVAPSGFADMEVTKSIVGRVLNFGDIIIRTQDETKGDRIMLKIRDPAKVSGQFREVMSRPIVRMEGQETTESQK